MDNMQFNNYTIENQLSDRFFEVTSLVDGLRKYGVIDNHSKIIVSCIFDEIKLHEDRKIIEAITVNHMFCPDLSDDKDYWSLNYLNGCIKHVLYYNYDGEQVIFDNDQEIILNDNYDIICQSEIYNACSRKLWPVRKNELWGFVDNSGLEVIACQFDYIGKFNEGRCWGGYNDKCAIIDISGNIIKEIDLLCSICDFSNGIATVRYWPEQLKESYHYFEFEKREINLNGELILRSHNGVKLLDKKYSWFQVTKDNMIEVYSDGKYGLLDMNLREIIPCRFNSIITSIIDNDLYITVTVNDENQISANELVNISKLDAIGKINVVFNEKDKCLIYNKLLDDITEIRTPYITAISSFYSKIRDKEGKTWIVIDDNGKEIVNNCQEVGYERCGMIPIKMQGKFLYINIDGDKIELPDHTTYVEPFRNGIGIVKVQLGKALHYKDEYFNGVRYGAVDKNGEVVIPFIYENLRWTDDCYISAVFRVNLFTNTKFKFNNKGEIVIDNETGQLSFKGIYSCEKLEGDAYRIISSNGVGIVDSNYNEILKTRVYAECFDMPYIEESKFILRINKFHYTDDYCKETQEIDSETRIVTYKDDNAVCLPIEYAWANEWIGEYIAVIKNNNWGIINSNLNEVSKFHFSKILAIDTDIALAINDHDELIKIDLMNKIETVLEYEYVSHNRANICVRKWNKVSRNDYEANYGLLDTRGNLVIECTHEYYEFEEMPDIDEDIVDVYVDLHGCDTYYHDAFEDDSATEWNRKDF